VVKNRQIFVTNFVTKLSQAKNGQNLSMQKMVKIGKKWAILG
jgi:hypothetical protein